jgi:hypothetical protein
MLDAIVSADFARVASEEGVLLVTRHVLIEDVLTEPFASDALIGGASHRLSPAYAVEAKLASVVLPGAERVNVVQPAADVVLLALVEADGSIAVVALDRRENPPGETDLAVTLPGGAWQGTSDAFAPPSNVDDTTANDVSTVISASEVLPLQVPANGIVIAHLHE